MQLHTFILACFSVFVDTGYRFSFKLLWLIALLLHCSSVYCYYVSFTKEKEVNITYIVRINVQTGHVFDAVVSAVFDCDICL